MQKKINTFSVLLTSVLTISAYTLLLYCSCFIVWNYYVADLSDHLKKAIHFPLNQFIQDIKKAHNILESIASVGEFNLKGKGLRNINKKVETSGLFQLILYSQIFIEDDVSIDQASIERVGGIFDVLVIRKLLKNKKSLSFKIDLSSALQQLKNSINNENIHFEISTKDGRSLLSDIKNKKGYSISEDEHLKNYLISTWYDESFVIKQRFKIYQAICVSLSIIFLLLFGIYQFSKWNLKKKTHAKHFAKIKKYQSQINTLSFENSILNNEILQVKEALKVKDEVDELFLTRIKAMSRELGNSINKYVETINGMRGSQLSISDLISMLKGIDSRVFKIHKFRLVPSGSEMVSVKKAWDMSIAYWLPQINEKKLTIKHNCSIDKVKLPFDETVLIQIFYSILGMVISALPKSKAITISSAAINDNITFEISDNGLGIGVDNIQNYSIKRKQGTKLMLSWTDIIDFFKEQDIIYSNNAVTGKGGVIRFTISLNQNSNQDLKTNVVSFKNIKR